MTDEQILLHINELVCKSLEGDMTAAESDALNRYIHQDPSFSAYYVRCVRIYSGLKRSPQMQYLFCLEQFEDNLKPFSLEALAEYEKIAPAAPTIRQRPARSEFVPSQNNVEKTVRKINKASLLTAIASLAALVFFVVFARYAPVRGTAYVATVADSIDAQWAETNRSLSQGVRLPKASDSHLLRKGIVRLVFDNETEVLVEGPAEFQIVAEDRIRINYGRLYAVVPHAALAFSVVTPNSTIIDLGTEFGVLAGFEGNTELHVIQGETALVTGHHDRRSSVLVGTGAAKRVYGASAAVSDIRINNSLFVRKINSEADLVWRGDAVSLADVVGGGGGFGDGVLSRGFNPLKGQPEVFSQIVRPSSGPSDYRSIPSSRLIDGIFIPNGTDGPMQVTSQGHLFEDCPPTNGEFWQGIFNGAWHGGVVAEIPRHALRLNGVTYGTREHPAIYMHANQGITFDLDALRETLNGLRLERFRSLAGISESVLDYPGLVVRDTEGRIESPMASFHVLVDGQVRFEQVDMTPDDEPTTINIPLATNDRFLTLITTQGSDKRGINHDWTLFAEPVLQVERP